MIFKREPVLLMGAIHSVLALLTAFGLQLSGVQIGAIMAASAAFLSLVTRRYVAPTATAGATSTVTMPEPLVPAV